MVLPLVYQAITSTVFLLATVSLGYTPACQNHYDRYCRILTNDKCYYKYNQRLCCVTCANFYLYYSNQPKEYYCPYGDRDSSCQTMPTDRCYQGRTPFTCCHSCGKAKTNIKGCRYGDKDVEFCSKIKPYHCYDETIRNKCCGSCARFYTGKLDCEYGDRNLFFEKSNRRYNCVAYVGYFGHGKCRIPREVKFRYACCQTCSRTNSYHNNYIYY